MKAHRQLLMSFLKFKYFSYSRAYNRFFSLEESADYPGGLFAFCSNHFLCNFLYEHLKIVFCNLNYVLINFDEKALYNFYGDIWNQHILFAKGCLQNKIAHISKMSVFLNFPLYQFQEKIGNFWVLEDNFNLWRSLGVVL